MFFLPLAFFFFWTCFHHVFTFSFFLAKDGDWVAWNDGGWFVGTQYCNLQLGDLCLWKGWRVDGDSVCAFFWQTNLSPNVVCCPTLELDVWPKVALGLLEDMQQTEVALDIIVFSAAISACEKAGQWTTAFDLFHHMQRQIVQVDAISVSAVISACEKAAQWEAAIDFLHHSLTSLRLPSNSVSFAAAISACEKAGEWTAACALLKSLQTSGVDMDAFPFSATISASSRAGEWQVALHILSQMKWHQAQHGWVQGFSCFFVQMVQQGCEGWS